MRAVGKHLRFDALKRGMRTSFLFKSIPKSEYKGRVFLNITGILSLNYLKRSPNVWNKNWGNKLML